MTSMVLESTSGVVRDTLGLGLKGLTLYIGKYPEYVWVPHRRSHAIRNMITSFSAYMA